MGKVDRIQAETRALKSDITSCTVGMTKLELKVVEMEDRSRRNNLRLVGLANNREGNNAVEFLQEMLPKWLPALKGPIEIERAHRIYSQKPSDNPQTHFQGTPLYGSPSNLKKLEKQATSRMPTGNTFFVDYSNATAQRRKAFSGIQKELYNLGLPSFLIYPATLRVTSRGKQQSFGTVEQAEDFLQKILTLKHSQDDSSSQMRQKLLTLKFPRLMWMTRFYTFHGGGPALWRLTS